MNMRTNIKFPVQEQKRQLLPEGIYKVRVIGTKEKKNKGTGEPYTRVTLKVIEGEHEGYELNLSLYYEGRNLFKLKKYLEVCGVEVPDGVMEFDIDDTLGSRFHIEVVHDEYMGNKYAKVKKLQ
jgi:hypothetical protein